METAEDYTLHYIVANTDYGMITIPKGTKVTHQTAIGIDKRYHFVDEFGWIYKNYPTVANLLQSDMSSYGLNVPKSLILKYR